MELDLNAGVRRQVVDGVTQHVALERDLVERLGVHEVVLAVALVEVLHVVLLEGDPLDLVLGAEAVLGLRPAPQVPELRLHHAAPVPRRHVDDVHHAPEVVLVGDDHARAELGGGNQHREGLSSTRRARPLHHDGRCATRVPFARPSW